MTVWLSDRSPDEPRPPDSQADAPALSKWGARAATVYTEAYAQQYRAADEAAGPELGPSEWLRGVCARFEYPIDALDLGCGTGRYFHALVNVKRLVGIDVSGSMLERARDPIGSVAMAPGWLTLVEGDFLNYDFPAGQFDLVYAIGVLAEHSPFDEAIAARVKRWLRPGGRFAFTTVHPLSFSVARTFKRRVAEGLLPVVPAPLRRALRARLMRDGIFADEERLREVFAAVGLAVESIDPFTSGVHRHLLAVARKT